MGNLEKIAKEFRSEVFASMIKSRGEKYKWFIRALKSFKYFSQDYLRAEILESSYAVFRRVDDIVDGDFPLSPEYKSSEEFVSQRIDFLDNLDKPVNEIDSTLLYCANLSNELGIDFMNEVKYIFSSLLFDSKRYGKKIIFSENELRNHYDLLDIKGTIRGALILFDCDPEKLDYLKDLGNASRIYYNLRDFEEDVSKGFINISLEDCEKYNITREKIENYFSAEVRTWFEDQAKKGIQLLESHRKNISSADFNFLPSLTFKLVYEYPAEKYFKKILKD